MAASTAQGCKLWGAASLDTTDASIDDRADDTTWVKIAGAVSIEAGAPIAGDIEATNLESTEIEMVDDLVEEASYPITVQSDLTEAGHQNLLAWQTPKLKVWFMIEIPRKGETTVSRVIINGWVRNYRWSGSTRSVQQASFDIMTRSAATISHGHAAEG